MSYLITESSTPPEADDENWSETAPESYTVATMGQKILYPWVKDASNNVSAVFGSPQTVVVTQQTVPRTPNGAVPGWDRRFTWTGIYEANWYLIEVVRVSDEVQMFYKWYTSPQTGGQGVTDCFIVPDVADLPGLPGDTYKWHALDYGDDYGYGVMSPFLEFSV